MRLYIDKGNIESFVQSAASRPNEFEKCNLMLKKHFDMQLNLSKQDFAQSELCMSWANTLLDGRGKNLIHLNAPTNIFPSRPINTTTFGDGFNEQQNSSVYLLEDSAIVSTLEAKGNYIVGDTGKEIDTLLQLMIGDDDELYTQSLPLQQHFATGNWNGLNNSVLPCADIIISDSYILSNPSLYAKNLIGFLNKITDLVGQSHINIVIFCLFETEYRGAMQSPNWSNVRNNIKYELGLVHIDASVTFVAPMTERDFEEHDRTVCTNYLYYVPGASLNFYDPRGNFTTRGRHFHVQSMAKSQHHDEALAFIHDMQTLINEIESGVKNGIIDKDPSPKLSNFLHFS